MTSKKKAKKSKVSKASAKKTAKKVVKKAAAKKAPAKKTVAKKAAAKKKTQGKKKTAVNKTAKKAPAKATAKKTAKKKATAKKATAKKATAKKATAKKTVAKKAPVKKPVVKKPVAKKPAPKKAKVPVRRSRSSMAGPGGGPIPKDYSPIVDLPKGYKPTNKDEYMGPHQLEYFRQKLLSWRSELVEESQQTIDHLRQEVRDVGDEAERATRETENSLELRTRDRYRKLLSKISDGLTRIDDGRYGYCDETGEEIGLARLEARPIATLTLDAQERWEHRQRHEGR